MARRNIFHFESHPDNKSDYKVTLKDVSDGVNPRVELLVSDEDWTCDCLSDDDPCIHVLSAAIVIKRENDLGRPAPALKSAEKYVQYEWATQKETLLLKRTISGENKALVGSLKNFLTGFKKNLDFNPSKVDLQIEDIKAYGNKLKFRRDLLKAMNNLDSNQMIGDVDSANPEVGGFELVMNGDRRETTIIIKKLQAKFFSNGFGIKDKTVFLLPEGDEWRLFQKFINKPVVIGGYQVDEFNSKILPKMQKVFGWMVPEGSFQSLRVYVYLIAQKQGRKLQITPRIGYGKPAQALLNQGRLEMKSSVPPPKRDTKIEHELRDELWQSCRLTLDEMRELSSVEDFKELSSWSRKGYELLGANIADFQFVEELAAFDLDALSSHSTWPGAEKSNVSVAEVVRAARKGEAFVQKKGLGLISIPARWIKKNSYRFIDIPNADAKNGKSPDLQKLPWQRIAIFESTGDVEELLAKQVGKTEATLRPYQSEGALWLLSLKQRNLGALLADDMGLGKTLQSIVTMNGQDLVVCPTSVMSNWKNELNRFRPDLKVCVYHGASRQLSVDPRTVVITSYGVLRSDVEKFTSVKWNSVVADESQVIKN
ncbi:SNF2-related protein, partial [Oligoflexaceae bacterium]|nr:SNF2-related protein [Oligoflexaceae bacterium]